MQRSTQIFPSIFEALLEKYHLFILSTGVNNFHINHSFVHLSGGTQQRFPPKCIENTFSLIHSTFKSLEMHSKWRYKSCICSVVLGQLESFRNYLGPQYYFPENFRCNFRFYESENFSDSSLHRIFESENFRFPFSTKNRLTWGLKCEKLNFRKS